MDVEQMYAAASEEYKNNYSTGEYCHEQSFLWGFQEGVEFMESESKSLSGNIVKTKYNIGDEVWFMCGSQIFCGRICCIVVWRDILSYQVEFENRLYNLFETSLFPTKEELIKSL